MASENLPTYASEEAALIAEVGDCCKGLNPFCTVKCLIEVAMEKRAAILAKRDEAAQKGRTRNLTLGELIDELRHMLATMKPGSRLDVFDGVIGDYCIHCGDPKIDGVCHCMNDE